MLRVVDLMADFVVCYPDFDKRCTVLVCSTTWMCSHAGLRKLIQCAKLQQFKNNFDLIFGKKGRSNKYLRQKSAYHAAISVLWWFNYCIITIAVVCLLHTMYYIWAKSVCMRSAVFSYENQRLIKQWEQNQNIMTHDLTPKSWYVTFVFSP